jgi:hypothetical protein
MSDQEHPSTKPEEDAASERGRESFFSGRYRAAFSHLHSAMLTRAIRWFREEGVQFQRPPGEVTPTALIIGLASAAHAELAERGDDGSDRLQTAAALFAAIAELRIALEQPAPKTDEGMHEMLAELVIRSAMVGQVDMLMRTTELGWLDKLAAYEEDRARRRAGADVVNARKADAKQQALNEAVRIAGRNPTLSNEDLARKIIDAAGLQITIRTATDWVREWRREEYLPPIKPTSR